MAVAAPGEAEALGEEALAELDDAPPAHREEIVVEEDVAHPEPLETPAHLHHVLDAVEAPAPARRGAVAEGAREGAAARRHHARHRRGAVVEDVRLEPEREVRHQVPRRLGQPIESLAVEILGARVGMHALAVAPDEARDGARIAARDQLRVRALALADHAVVEAREHGERRLGHGAHVRAADGDDDARHERLQTRRDAGRVADRDGGGGDADVVGDQRRHLPGHLLDRRPRALPVHDVDAVALLARDRGQRERADAGDLLLALAHPVAPAVPAHVGRLDEDHGPGPHGGRIAEPEAAGKERLRRVPRGR